jgi:hypothetical protein
MIKLATFSQHVPIAIGILLVGAVGFRAAKAQAWPAMQMSSACALLYVGGRTIAQK